MRVGRAAVGGGEQSRASRHCAGAAAASRASTAAREFVVERGMSAPAGQLDLKARHDLLRLARQVSSAADELRTLRCSVEGQESVSLADAFSHWVYQHWYLVPDDDETTGPAQHLRVNLPGAFRSVLPSATRWTNGWVAMSPGSAGGCVAGKRGQI